MIGTLLEVLPWLAVLLGGTIFLTILTVRVPVVALSIAFFLYTGPTFGLLPRFDGRPALILVILILILSGKKVPSYSKYVQGRLRNLLIAIMVVVVAGAVSLLWSDSPNQTMSSVIALVLLLVTMVVLPRRLSASQIYNSVMLSSALIVLPSLIAGLAGVSEAWRAGRLAGILFNPNALSIYALILATGSLLMVNRWLGGILLISAITTIILSASRGSGISVVLTCLFYFWFTFRSFIQRFVLCAMTLGFAYWLTNSAYIAEQAENPESIFRINNSRENYNDIAIADIKESWPLGTGLGTASEAAVNILFKVLAELGPLGLIVLITLVTFCFVSARRNISALTVLISGLVANVFEGWLISAGNTFTVLFFHLLILTCIKDDASSLDSGTPPKGDKDKFTLKMNLIN